VELIISLRTIILAITNQIWYQAINYSRKNKPGTSELASGTAVFSEVSSMSATVKLKGDTNGLNARKMRDVESDHQDRSV